MGVFRLSWGYIGYMTHWSTALQIIISSVVAPHKEGLADSSTKTRSEIYFNELVKKSVQRDFQGASQKKTSTKVLTERSQ